MWGAFRVKLARYSLLGLAAVCLATAAGAQWSDSSGKTDCAFRRHYTDGTELEFGVNRNYDYGTLVLWNDKWQSIRAENEYQIDISGDGADFGTFPAKGMRTSYGSSGLFIVVDSKETFRTLANYSVIQLRIKGRLIGRYNLSGAAREMTRALLCASADEVEDPFSI